MIKTDIDRQWIAYVRVSKVGGREGESFLSPDQQESKIKAEVASRGGSIAQTVIELDASGRSMVRQKLTDALEWVYDDPARRGFAVMDISRLARNLKGALDVIESLQDLGAGFLSVHERMDTTTPAGRLAIQNMAGIAEFQSNVISERWRLVQSDRVEDGLPSGGPARFGYEAVVTIDDQGRKKRARIHTPHEVNGPILAGMYRDFIAGKGAMSLADDLNRREVKTERGNTWNIQGVLRTLDCGFGAGQILIGTYDTEVVRDPETNRPIIENGRPKMRRRRTGSRFEAGKHEPVITPEEWEQYQATRRKRRTKAPRHKHPRWHLAGLAKCGLCGGSLSVSSYRDARTLVICTKYKTSRTCTGTWMSKAKLDRALFWWLGTRVDELARSTGSSKDRQREHTKAANARDKARARLDKLSREVVGMARLYAAGDLTEAQYRDAKRENATETSAAQAEFDEAESRFERLVPTDDVFETLIKWGEEHPDPAEYNVLLAKIIDRIEVTKEEVVIYPVVGEPHDVPRL